MSAEERCAMARQSGSRVAPVPDFVKCSKKRCPEDAVVMVIDDAGAVMSCLTSLIEDRRVDVPGKSTLE